MIPLPELGAKNHTPARSRYSGKKMVTLCSQRDEHAVNQQVTGSMTAGIEGVEPKANRGVGPWTRSPGGRLSAAGATPHSIRVGTRSRVPRVKKWHGKMELGTLTYLAFHPEAPAMHLDEMFGDGQAEAGASRFAGTRDVNAIEAFKNAWLVGLRDADAGVRDGKNNLFLHSFRA